MAVDSPFRQDIVAHLQQAPLPFSDRKQLAFLGHCLDEKTGLFRYIKPFADKTWFSSTVAGECYDYLRKFNEPHGELPTLASIENDNYFQRMDKEKSKAIVNGFRRALEDRREFPPKTLQDDLVIWMQAKILQRAGEKAALHHKAAEFADAAKAFEEGVKLYRESRFALGNFKPISDIKALAAGQGKDAVVTFGLQGIDNHLFPNNPKGGLRKGDQTLILAPSNMGKTTTLITVAIHNVLAGHLVLFLTHEGRDTDIRVKLARCFFNLIQPVHVMEIFGITKPETVAMVIQKFRLAGFDMDSFLSICTGADRWAMLCAKALTWLDTKIKYGSQNKPFLTVEEVIPVVDRAQEECADANGGKTFDLFLDDYPGLLQTEMNKKGNYQQRQVSDMVYGAFVQLALQHGWHSMVAIQTNRDGSKATSGYSSKYSNKPQEIRFLRKEDVMEAWGPITTATNVITVNRSPAAMAGGWLTYFLDKSRSSSTQLAVTTFERYAQCVSHANEFGWVSYFMDTENRRLMQSFMEKGTGKFLHTPDIAARLQELEAADEVAAKAA